MMLHRHRAIFWCAVGVARLNSRGWGCLKRHALCQTGFEEFFYRDLSSPLIKSLEFPSNAGGIVSSWVSCCCTDTGLSSGVHLGVARLNPRGWGCLKSHALCQTGFEEFFYRDLSSPLIKSLEFPSNAGGIVSSWVSCCCTDTGLSSGVHLG